MNDFLTILLSELKFVVIYEPSSSPDIVYVFIENLEGKEFSRFQIERNFLMRDSLDSDRKEKLKTLFYNGIWPLRDAILKDVDVINFIDSNHPDTDASEKQERILSFIRSQSPYDGYEITISTNDYVFSDVWRKTYVKNIYEFVFYLDSLIDANYLSCQGRTDDKYFGVVLTISGLNKVVLFEEKNNSKTCFVAMSFDKDLRDIYDQGIVPALKETGFDPLRVDDDKTISSDITINDAILAAIKKSKFTIADFTQHKKGVYFESGYALGKGQKVIYTCREDEINNAHFDTRNYPHIVWTDAEDLKKKLIDKIEVFIKI